MLICVTICLLLSSNVLQFVSCYPQDLLDLKLAFLTVSLLVLFLFPPLPLWPINSPDEDKSFSSSIPSCFCILIILWSFNSDTIYPCITRYPRLRLRRYRLMQEHSGERKLEAFKLFLKIRLDLEYASLEKLPNRWYPSVTRLVVGVCFCSCPIIFYWVYTEAWTLSVFGFIVLLITKYHIINQI